VATVRQELRSDAIRALVDKVALARLDRTAIVEHLEQETDMAHLVALLTRSHLA
jgi:hypothetical protein